MLKVRVKFKRYGAMRFIGHLDLMRYFQKAVRRAELPAAYSQGFSPHMIMSFANPLGVGLTSDGEYFDMELTTAVASKEALKRLNDMMVEGMEVLNVVEISDAKKDTGMAIVAAAAYNVRDVKGILPKHYQDELKRFYAQKEICIQKKTKRSEQTVDIRPLIYELEMQGDAIYMKVSAGSVQNLKPELVMEAFNTFLGIDVDTSFLAYHRLDNFAKDADGNLVPLDALGWEIKETA